MIVIECQRCGTPVNAQRKTRKWCDDCTTRVKDTTPRQLTCGWCTKPFTAARDMKERAKRHCSPDCSNAASTKAKVESAKRRRRGEPKRLPGRPVELTPEESATRKREGVVSRWFRRNPDRPRKCEACGETRVVELAHKKPRNGAARLLSNTGPDDVWVLCPTCHRVLDYGIETAEELGLKP